jgi:hypothetical protein
VTPGSPESAKFCCEPDARSPTNRPEPSTKAGVVSGRSSRNGASVPVRAGRCAVPARGLGGERQPPEIEESSTVWQADTHTESTPSTKKTGDIRTHAIEDSDTQCNTRPLSHGRPAESHRAYPLQKQFMPARSMCRNNRTPARDQHLHGCS